MGPLIETRNLINLFTNITFRDVLQGFILKTFCLLPAHSPLPQPAEPPKPTDDYPLPVIKVPVDIKNKVHPIKGHESPDGEKRYSATLSVTSALDGMGYQHHAPAALPSVKAWYPLYRGLG